MQAKNLSASTCRNGALASLLLSSCCLATVQAQSPFPGGGFQGYPGTYRVNVGYSGVPVQAMVPGSEPAAGQLRGYPAQIAPPTLAGERGDPAAIYRTPYVPDVIYSGPRPYSAGYRDLNRLGRPRLFRTPQTGTGLPLVTYGGFWDNRGPIEFTTPAYGIFSGYYGSVAPVVPTAPPVVQAAP